MTIFFGNTPISKLFLGNKEINKAYVGPNVVYSEGGSPATEGVALVNNNRSLAFGTDYELPDGSFIKEAFTVPYLYCDANEQYEDYHGGFEGWQFSQSLFHREDGTSGTISWVSLSQTPIEFPITVGSYTWTSNSDNESDNEGMKRLATKRTSNSISTGILNPAPYPVMGSLLNKQDFVGTLKVEGLDPETNFALDVYLDTLVENMNVSDDEVNIVNTGVPLAIAVFNEEGTQIGLNCTSGYDNAHGENDPTHPTWMRQCGALYDGVTNYYNPVTTNLRVAFKTGTATPTALNPNPKCTVYIAVMYKGSMWSGNTPGNCVWYSGTIGLNTNYYGNNINVPLYLNVDADEMMGQYVAVSATNRNYGNAKYTITTHWDGTGTLGIIQGN